MKRLIIVAVILLLTLSLQANINVQMKGQNKQLSIAETTINGIRYVETDDFAGVFKSISRQDRIDNRLYLHVYDEQFIFLINSPYYTFKNETFSMHYPLVRKASKLYLPSFFVSDQLVLHFPTSVTVKGKLLTVEVPRDNRVMRIVLDPGHGGKDPGAVGRKAHGQEKVINLGVALKLKKLLEQELGITVLLTRSDDRFVSLQDRTKYANDERADLFVSLHTNSSKDSKARGLETYYLSTAQSSDARAVEALENGVVELFEGGTAAKSKYDDLNFILSDLSQTEHLESSNNLANSIQQNIVAGTQSYDRGVKQANFYVLRGAFMPAILVEMGFISNGDEEYLLLNGEYQERMARTIFEGIKRFKYRYDRIRNT